MHFYACAHESTPWSLLVLFRILLYKQRNWYWRVDSFALSLKSGNIYGGSFHLMIVIFVMVLLIARQKPIDCNNAFGAS
jgi:presenilin-like A22 family membrane protease